MKKKMKIFCLAALGLLSFAASAQGSKVKALQVDVFPMGEFPAGFSYRLFAKGYDSNPKSWGMDYARASFSTKTGISYRVNKGKFFSGKKDLKLFQNNRIIINFENGKATMYLNGEKIAEDTGITPPPDNNYKLVQGSYMNGMFKFPGKVTVKTFEQPLKIEKNTSPAPTTHFSFVSTRDYRKKNPFKVLKGNWKMSPWGFGEFSDSVDMKALAILEKQLPESYVFTTRIGTLDNAGKIYLEFCRQDANNGYRLVLDASSAQKAVYLYKREKGKETLLNKVSSDKVKIPHAGNRFRPLTISIGRHEGMIHVRLEGVEVLNAFDNTFKKGMIGLGVHERKAKFREVTVITYPEYQVESKPKPLAMHELILSTPSMRTVFFRDEKIIVNAEVVNRTASAFTPGKIQFFSDGQTQSWMPAKIPALNSAKYQFALDGKKMRDGEYALTLSNGTLKTTFHLTLVTRPETKDLYTFYNWGSGDLALMNKHHFNGITIVISPKDEIKYLRPMLAVRNDYAMKHNMKLGIHIPLVSQVPAGGKNMCLVRKDGSSSGKLNPRNEAAKKYLKTRVSAIVDMLKDYPAIDRILLDSEVENFLELSYGKDDIARAKKELGFEPPMSETSDVELDGTQGRRVSLPKSVKEKTPAVFPITDKNYQFMLWYWERGAGDNLLRQEIAPIIKKAMPHVHVHHDPYRDVPLSSRMLGMDLVGTWYYCHPDAGETFMAVESLLSACRAAGKPEKFILGPSLWLYNQRIGPSKALWAGVQPANIYLTALHLGFAARPEMIEIFELNFLMPHSKPEFREKHIKDEVSNFAKNFVKPLWSATRHLDREEPKTALMLSFGSQIFSRSHWSGYGGAQANAILNLFWKANIPTAIITEEAIRKGALTKYDRILLYRTSHLPQDVFDKIKEFAAKGGTVLTEPDSPWAKLIPSAIKFPIPADKLSKSTYYEVRYKRGNTADIVYSEQQRIARELRKFRKTGDTFADSNSTELYIRTLRKFGSRYVFLMNDKRTFGDYFGKKYKAVYDAGLPLKAEVTLKNAAAVYEYPAKRKLSPVNGKITLDFKPTEGKILIIYPEAVAAVKIEKHPAFSQEFVAGKPAKFEISVLNNKQKKIPGIQPIRVVLTNPAGKKVEQFISAVNGTAVFTYLPGFNEPAGSWKLEAEELASGAKATLRWDKK